MIANDAEIIQHFVENWTKVLPNYINKIEDQIISRKIFPVRQVGKDVAIDIVQVYDRTGAGARIVAKGTPPQGSGSVASDVPHTLYQILDGFDIHEKDLSLDPKLKERNLEIILKNVHREENILAVNGSAAHGISGVVPAAVANTNGSVATTETVGGWDGSDTNRNIYNDLLLALTHFDSDRTARWLIGNKADLTWLYAKDDDNREPFWKSCCTLFGKTPQDPLDSWMIPVSTNVLATGNVYLADMDTEVAELVVSENPTIRPIGLQRGGNYPIELYEWLTVEIHDNNAFVKCATTHT